MVIEALSFGRVIGACDIPDEWIDNPDLPYLTDQIDHRKEAADVELELFQKKIDRFFYPWDQVRYRLVFYSKMKEK